MARRARPQTGPIVVVLGVAGDGGLVLPAVTPLLAVGQVDGPGEVVAVRPPRETPTGGDVGVANAPTGLPRHGRLRAARVAVLHRPATGAPRRDAGRRPALADAEEATVVLGVGANAVDADAQVPHGALARPVRPEGRLAAGAPAREVLAQGPVADAVPGGVDAFRRTIVRGVGQTLGPRPAVAAVLVAGALAVPVRVPARPVHDAAAIEGVLLRRPFRLPPVFLLRGRAVAEERVTSEMAARLRAVVPTDSPNDERKSCPNTIKS